MRNTWPVVPMGAVLRHRKEFIQISDLETYKRCRVQLHAKGIVLRDIVVGSEIKTKEQQICRAGEFLVAEIDAKVGGFGVVPVELDGAIVSSHYFLFHVDETLLHGRFLDFFSRTPVFREQVSAQGSTNYAAIRPRDVLGYKIPLPSLEEQGRIVARIEELADKVEEAQSLRRRTAEESEAFLTITTNAAFDNEMGAALLGRRLFSCFLLLRQGLRGGSPPISRPLKAPRAGICPPAQEGLRIRSFLQNDSFYVCHSEWSEESNSR